MYIHRIQVEEGFLDGLDLTFRPGLNVLIGPRGSGKTSVIELIRFCLDAESSSDRFRKAAREHALSILGAGRVTVVLRDGGSDVVVTRARDDASPRTSGRYSLPGIYSQLEIENVGVDPAGRLRILDAFVNQSAVLQDDVSLVHEVRSLTAEISSLLRQLEAEEDGRARLADAAASLVKAQAEQAALFAGISAAAPEKEDLANLSAVIPTFTVRHEVVASALREIQSWQESIATTIQKTPALPPWHSSAGEVDLLAESREQLLAAGTQVADASALVERILEGLQSLEALVGGERARHEDRARELRKKLEELQEGASASSLRVSHEQERLAQFNAAKVRIDHHKTKIAALQERRGNALTELERRGNALYQARRAAADSLTSELGPTIQIRAHRGSEDQNYAGLVREHLRGSGLHYNSLAPMIAQRMSPRELGEAVESGDVELLSRVLEIPPARAARVASELRNADLGGIMTLPVADSVTMLLLHGPDYKPTNELSTGQRCTVVLSALLAQPGPPLVVDQPEDHLDNAYIVDALVHSILRAKSDRQLIFSTHNPNIPVLADADLIALLGSDGRRGFVRHAEPLNDPLSVGAITSVMEGGAEAFARRAAFYDRAGAP